MSRVVTRDNLMQGLEALIKLSIPRTENRAFRHHNKKERVTRVTTRDSAGTARVAARAAPEQTDLDERYSMSENKDITPAKGTNPDRFPVAHASLLDFLRQQGVARAELSYVTSMAVGHAVSVYWGSKSLFGTKADVYQVMRWDESEGPGYEFWRDHQLCERPQWFDTPEAACAAYVASYWEWRRKQERSA